MHPALLAADWPAPPGVRGFTTLRHGAGGAQAPFDTFNMGLRCGDDPAAVTRNRGELVGLARLPAAPVWLRQVHGTGVFRVGSHAGTPRGNPPRPVAEAAAGAPPERAEVTGPAARDVAAGRDSGNAEPEADAAVTSVPGAVLAILTADCLPVLFCADDGSEVGASHAGWRGLAAGVLEATVAAMATPPERLMAWLGPAAGPASYEIGTEVHNAFVSRDADAVDAFTPTRPGHWRVDLYALARRRLEKAGLSAGRISGGGLCTIADPQRFYSHRRDQHTGRMATMVWIEPSK